MKQWGGRDTHQALWRRAGRRGASRERMGEEKRYSPMEKLVCTGYLPLLSGVDLEVNALSEVSRHSRGLR